MVRTYSPVKAKEIEPVSFLITECPAAEELNDFIVALKGSNVKNLVRISQPTYPTDKLVAEGIAVHEYYFEDGHVPGMELVNNFLALVKQLQSEPNVIAIHCVSGIGRAPLLVCCALIAGGMDRLDAVEYVRKHRRGAINKTQLSWVTDSKKGFKLKKQGFFSRLFSQKSTI